MDVAGREDDGPGRGTDAEDRAALLDAERDSLYRFVRSLAGNDPHFVDDVVQDTLLRAWQHADRLHWRDQPIRMWLFRVARNLVIDGWRRERITVPVGVAPTDFPYPAPAAAAPDELARVMDRRVLVDALRELPAIHREVLVRVHVMDMPGDELARLLDIPSGTVKSRTHHGLRMLRRRLAASGAAA